MSKRNSDGDVLSNRLSLGLAKNQKLLASWMGTHTNAQPATDTSKSEEEEDNDLKQESFGHDRLGVGGIRPKDIEDGSFMKRTLTTNDKLLEQLIGKKKAKAHLAAKLQATRLGAQPQPKHSRQAASKKEDSEDEEEGRASAFQSKKRKVVKPKRTVVSDGEDDEGAEDATKVVPVTQPVEDGKEQDEAVETQKSKEDDEEADAPPVKTTSKSIPSRGRAKPVSYLDELLAERSKKKKNKTKNKVAAQT